MLNKFCLIILLLYIEWTVSYIKIDEALGKYRLFSKFPKKKTNLTKNKLHKKILYKNFMHDDRGPVEFDVGKFILPDDTKDVSARHCSNKSAFKRLQIPFFFHRKKEPTTKKTTKRRKLLNEFNKKSTSSFPIETNYFTDEMFTDYKFSTEEPNLKSKKFIDIQLLTDRPKKAMINTNMIHNSRQFFQRHFISPYPKGLNIFEDSNLLIDRKKRDDASRIEQNKDYSSSDENENSTDSDTILTVLRRLLTQMEMLPTLATRVQAIQNKLVKLKSMKNNFKDIKDSVGLIQKSVNDLNSKIAFMEKEIDSLKKSKEEVANTMRKHGNKYHHSTEKRPSSYTIEICGVPITRAENLSTIVEKIGKIINCSISRDQIKHVERVPKPNDKHSQNIICSVKNKNIKNKFLAAAKKHKFVKASDLGLPGKNTIYVNDHSLLEKKVWCPIKARMRTRQRMSVGERKKENGA